MPTEQPAGPDVAESTATDRDAHDHAAVTESSPGSDDSTTSDGDRVATLERRVADLEGELEAVRGLLAGVKTVDERVERRASAALAKAEAVEEQFAPEETGLVRERLPDPSGDARCENSVGERTPEARDGDSEGPPRRASSPTRSDSERDNEKREKTAEPRGGDGRGSARGGDTQGRTGSAGRGRRHAGDVNTADGKATETGAISSVSSGAAPGGSATGSGEDIDRSLAARLRDAFR